MIDFFNQGGIKADIHSFIASKMFGVPVSKNENSHLRQKGKRTGFTIAYGGGAHKLADYFSISIEEGQELVDFFFKAFPTLKKFFKEETNKSLANGYILVDNITKRRSYHPDVERFITTSIMMQVDPNGVTKEDRSFFYRVKSQIGRNTQNYKIQGLAGSMTKLANIYLREEILARGWQDRVQIVNVIHDQILTHCKNEIADEVALLMKYCMTKAGKALVSKVDMLSEVEISDHWAH